MTPLRISAFTSTSALGRGNAAAARALRERRGGLRRNDFPETPLETWIGRVDGLEDAPLTGALAPFDCRNNRLALVALEQDGLGAAVRAAAPRYGAGRIAVFLGTSTSGILESERAYARRPTPETPFGPALRFETTQGTFSVAACVQAALGLTGPALVMSTACSSSAKVFASAERAIAAGWCDAALVGGVDSLCLTTLHGFHSLELVSARPCRPWDAGRDGISIGEAGGFALLERAAPGAPGPRLAGYGESSDAHHMTAPHPQGAGALRAMREALERAGLAAAAVDYVNLHGTATPSNDAAEDAALFALFGDATPCSSTKGWTGHTLAAAGIVEAVLTLVAMEQGLLPGTLNLEAPDPALRAHVLRDNAPGTVRVAMSNSFGFGGNNCSLLFARDG